MQTTKWIHMRFMIDHLNTYRVRKFPFRDVGELFVVVFLTFNWDNWLALVRGNRGDGLPVPGRTTCGLAASVSSARDRRANSSVCVAASCDRCRDFIVSRVEAARRIDSRLRKVNNNPRPMLGHRNRFTECRSLLAPFLNPLAGWLGGWSVLPLRSPSIGEHHRRRTTSRKFSDSNTFDIDRIAVSSCAWSAGQNGWCIYFSNWCRCDCKDRVRFG